jgi:general nucleoside transport system ATP-binding protein
VLGGQRRATAGVVKVNGAFFRMTRREIQKHDLHVLPEEPLRNACAPLMSVAENLALRIFDRKPIALGGWFLNQKAIRQNSKKWIQRFNIKTPSESSVIGNLSGGNVQRVVLARELGAGTAKVLIAANPCFGLDFAAVDFINSQLLEARNKGVAVLLLSEDLDELLSLADRILVMAGGQLVYESKVAEADVKIIGERMAGH